ncbi:hypothetical protein [Qaidamihabitans albus]|uniref:hypothetical protein n=1 Tax=Qaidamihabitans albus TaxID=2795733 RepID=UPI0027DDE0D1|nr:hypothetical protein [Qaidamihabitans albus]
MASDVHRERQGTLTYVRVLIVGVFALLIGVLALGVPAPAATAEPAAVVAPVLAQDSTTEPGPELDPQTEADARKTKNKLIVGGVALVLLIIVIWGRRTRNKRKPGKK